MSQTALLEVGNTTYKIARRISETSWSVERFSNPVSCIEALDRSVNRPTLLIPTSPGRTDALIETAGLDGIGIPILDRTRFASFIDGVYDTPETLGFDRILQLFGLDDDAVVISYGTAITVDALIAGRPCFGGILAGRRPVESALAAAAPSLPRPDIMTRPVLPSRSSDASVSLGLAASLVDAPLGLARRLAGLVGREAMSPLMLRLTGGDALTMADHIRAIAPEHGFADVSVDPDLLFDGAALLAV